MVCSCQQKRISDSVKAQQQVQKTEAMTNEVLSEMAKLVNFEGRLVPQNTIPKGSAYIRGVWYSSPDKVPENIAKQYIKFIADWKKSNR